MSEIVRVCELAEQLRGVTYSKSDASSTPRPGYLPMLRAGNIAEDGLTFDDLVFVPAERISAKQKIRRNDVVIAASSGSLDVVGKAARALDDYEAGFGAFCKVLRPGPDVDPAYFAHFFRTQQYRQRVSALAAGVNINNLRNEHLGEFQIPIPALPEQRRIAEILDKADALRAKRREVLAQLDTLLQSTFLHMFGDPVTNPMGWEMRSLGDLAVEKPNNGIFRRNPEYSESLDSGLPVVWVAELFRGTRIDVSKSRRLEANQAEIEKYGLLPGDLLFCRSSLKLDGIAYNNVFLGGPEEALFECHLIRVSLRTDVVNPMFLNLQLRSGPMRAVLKSKSKTATMTTIDQKALSSVEVVVPPVGLQNRFVAIVESVEQQKVRQRAHLAELDTLFASLQYRAFRGEL